jgi:hypothetical protein
VERTHIYATLAAALAKRGFDPATIEKYGQLWDSITATDGIPCPLCFTYSGKLSVLKPFPQEARKDPMRCAACLTVFYSG